MLIAVIIAHRPGRSDPTILVFEDTMDVQKKTLNDLSIFRNPVFRNTADICVIKDGVHLSIRVQVGNKVSFSFSGSSYDTDKDVSSYEICVFDDEVEARGWIEKQLLL